MAGTLIKEKIVHLFVKRRENNDAEEVLAFDWKDLLRLVSLSRQIVTKTGARTAWQNPTTLPASELAAGMASADEVTCHCPGEGEHSEWLNTLLAPWHPNLFLRCEDVDWGGGTGIRLYNTLQAKMITRDMRPGGVGAYSSTAFKPVVFIAELVVITRAQFLKGRNVGPSSFKRANEVLKELGCPPIGSPLEGFPFDKLRD